MNYDNMKDLFTDVADKIWKNAMTVVNVAAKNRINVEWYNFYRNPRSVAERYEYGYWLAFYLYHDLKQKFIFNGQKKLAQDVEKAYYSRDWSKFF
jgi:hypothetical protein